MNKHVILIINLFNIINSTPILYDKNLDNFTNNFNNGLFPIWKYPNITWSYINDTKNININKHYRDIINDLKVSFNHWQVNLEKNIKFIYIPNNNNSDIIIKFIDNINHNNTNDKNTLGHAYKPGSGIGGDIHFNANIKNWAFNGSKIHNEEENILFHAVAIHEIGHSIGLFHTNTIESIMFPYYRGNKDIHTIDKNQFKFLYISNNRLSDKDIMDIYIYCDDIRIRKNITIPTNSTTTTIKPIINSSINSTIIPSYTPVISIILYNNFKKLQNILLNMYINITLFF